MNNVTTRLFIVSTFESGESERYNILNHENTLEFLKSQGLNPVSIDGVFKGKKELSIALSGDNNLESKVRNIALDNRQESYLVVYWDRMAELVNPLTGETTILGKWTETTETNAKDKDHSLINGVYYIIESKNV